MLVPVILFKESIFVKSGAGILGCFELTSKAALRLSLLKLIVTKKRKRLKDVA